MTKVSDTAPKATPPTKTRIYRNIILDSHLIIYRIADERVEAPDILHSASSISRIKSARKIHIEEGTKKRKASSTHGDLPSF